MLHHLISLFRRLFRSADRVRATVPHDTDATASNEAERIRAKLHKWSHQAAEYERLHLPILARDMRERIQFYSRHLRMLEGSLRQHSHSKAA